MGNSKYVVQACTDREYRVKTVIICTLLMIFALTALGLMIYNLIKLRFGFVIGYALGMVLAVLYVLIRMNIAFSTNVSADRSYLYLTTWENKLLPYKISCNIPFIREFIPEKNQKLRIDINEISNLYIGTKSFITRNMDRPQFNEQFGKDFKHSDLKKINKADILCILTESNTYFMSVEGFDSKSLYKIIQNILRVNPKIDFHAGSKKYRGYYR